MRAAALTSAEFGAALRGVQRSAFRLEQQASYDVAEEAEAWQRWQAGDPIPPPDLPLARDWFAFLATLARRGATVTRVRVQADPPTDYQQWERWAGRWSVEAGERISYLTSAQAQETGLSAVAGGNDWWVLDDQVLVVMMFDDDHTRTVIEQVTDPAVVGTACAWRDLAVRHAIA